MGTFLNSNSSSPLALIETAFRQPQMNRAFYSLRSVPPKFVTGLNRSLLLLFSEIFTFCVTKMRANAKLRHISKMTRL